MSGVYPELETQRDFIGKMVRIEEERFGNTVTIGLNKLNELGISPSTLRRWQAVGIAHALMLPTGHRRFTLEEIERLMPKATEPDTQEA